MAEKMEVNRRWLIVGGGGVLLALLFFMTRGSGQAVEGASGGVNVNALNSLANSFNAALEALRGEWSTAYENLRGEWAAALDAFRGEVETRLTEVETATGEQIADLSAQQSEIRGLLAPVQSTLAGLQTSITNLTQQATGASSTAQLALKESAYARAETAWLTTVAVSGPQATVQQLTAARDWLLANTVKGLDPAQKAQWTRWVNSYIADWKARGHGGGGELSLFEPLMAAGSDGTGGLPDLFSTAPANPSRVPPPNRVRLSYGIRRM